MSHKEILAEVATVKDKCFAQQDIAELLQTRPKFPLHIGFMTIGLTFNGHTVKEQSLGGSETALYYMALELAKLGHRVKVFCKCDRPGEYDGVTYYNIDDTRDLQLSFQFDVMIVSRFFDMYSHHNNWKAPLRILWNHDVPPSMKERVLPFLYPVDMTFCLSDYHKQLWEDVVPEASPIIELTTNGLDFAMIEKAARSSKKKKRNKLIYAARPERGLDVLLRDIFPKLKKELPELELCIAGYDLGNFPIGEDTKALYEYINALIENTPGAVRLGSLPKAEYYKHLAEAWLYVYPTKFPEINCISALEAQALGTAFISTADFALNETVKISEWLVEGDCATPEYQEAFLQKCLYYLNPENTEVYNTQTTKAKQIVQQRYSWKKIAEEWETLFVEFFYRRFENNKDAVAENMLYYEDTIPALFIPEVQKETTDRIYARLDDIHGQQEEYDENTAGDFDYFLNQDNWKANETMGMGRYANLLQMLKKEGARVLDVGCHYGEFGVFTNFRRPDLEVVGLDFSEGAVEKAKRLIAEVAPHPDKLTVHTGSVLEDLPYTEEFDYVVAGEILEHIVDFQAFIERLEKVTKPGGRIIITVPSGPWAAWLVTDATNKLTHLYHYTISDCEALFNRKKEFDLFYNNYATSPRGEQVGHWVVAYTKAEAEQGIKEEAHPTGKMQLLKKIVTYRPYQKISACMIVKDEEANIVRCLRSLEHVFDEVLVLDTGSSDRTVSLAKSTLPNITVRKKTWSSFDFGVARNESKRLAKGDWIFWIDADEVLTDPQELRKYTDTTIFNAFVVSQNHLILDTQIPPDAPNRLFRNLPQYEFVGSIHEHPEDTSLGDYDNPIRPTFPLQDCKIVHTGYLTEKERRIKMGLRNLRALMVDIKKHPERKLSWALLARDYMNMTNWYLETVRYQGLRREEVNYLRGIVKIHKEKFFSPDTMYHNITYPFYQQALALMARFGVVTEEGHLPFWVVLNLGGGRPEFAGMPNQQEIEAKSRPSIIWFESPDVLREFLPEKLELLLTKIQFSEPVGGVKNDN